MDLLAPPTSMRQQQAATAGSSKTFSNVLFKGRFPPPPPSPVVLTPPSSTRVEGDVPESGGAGASNILNLSSEADDDNILTVVIAKVMEVIEGQAVTQCEMAEHQGDFQWMLADVLTSHAEQLMAQVVIQQAMVASNEKFKRSVVEVLIAQDAQQATETEQYG